LQNAILKTVAELVECRDSITGGHIERTQHYLSLLVDFLLEHNVYAEELSSWDIGLFIMSSQLHDVGKISIKDDLLMKPGKLTDEEFEEMKKHTLFGVDIIRKIEGSTTDNEFLLYAETLAGSHHEKWNGTGYPYGLKGEEIPLQGRLMAIVDVYDALTNDRPYKKAFTHEESVAIIGKENGAHFDPSIAGIFLTHEQEFKSAKHNKTVDNNQNQKPSRHLPATLTMVSSIMDTKGGGHMDSMRQYLKIFINALLTQEKYKNEVSQWNIDFFLISAQLHDVGKIAVNNNILNKAGTLTKDEYAHVQSHVDSGVKVIHQIRDNVRDGNLLHHAEVLATSHHEKWDGTGYPLGLKGKDIPLEGRVMAIIDVYSALVSDRPHRCKKSHKEAVDIVRRCSGTHFDPELVEVFLDHEKEFGKIR
jgi:HD-GYP domain-containing protein (c-di-GMP phosphodiesterase class II)